MGLQVLDLILSQIACHAGHGCIGILERLPDSACRSKDFSSLRVIGFEGGLAFKHEDGKLHLDRPEPQLAFFVARVGSRSRGRRRCRLVAWRRKTG